MTNNIITKNNRYTTTNRKLENFLYLHKIQFVNQYKGDDGMNRWTYIVTPRFKEVLDEYKKLYSDEWR